MFEELVSALQARGIAIDKHVTPRAHQPGHHRVMAAPRSEFDHGRIANHAGRQTEVAVERLPPFDMLPQIGNVLPRGDDPKRGIKVDEGYFATGHGFQA